MTQLETEAKPIVTRNQALGWLRQMMCVCWNPALRCGAARRKMRARTRIWRRRI